MSRPAAQQPASQPAQTSYHSQIHQTPSLATGATPRHVSGSANAAKSGSLRATCDALLACAEGGAHAFMHSAMHGWCG